MILFLIYLSCTVEPDYFQIAIDNIDSYYDMRTKIADNPEDC